MNGSATGCLVACWRALAVLVLAACSPACGGSSDSDPPGDTGGTHASCQEACEHIEVVCPDIWGSVDECVQPCQNEPFSQASIDCVVGVDDCAGVESCSQ